MLINHENNLISYKIMCVLFLLLLILVFFPLVDTGFTTNDDLRTATGAFGNWINAAKAQGRFSFIINGYLSDLPYWVDGIWYYQSVRLGSVALNFFLISLVLYRIFQSQVISLLSITFALGFLQNSWGHCLLTSYPFIFQAGTSFFILSVVFFIEYKSKNKICYAFISGFLYLLALLVNEIFVLYFLVFLMIAGFSIQDKPQHQKKYKSFYKKIFPILAALTIYLVLYFLFRAIFPSNYDGNQVGGKLKNIFPVIWQYSIAAWPGYFFFSPRGAANYQGLVFSFGPATYSFSTIISEVRVEWLIKSLVVMFSTGFILQKFSKKLDKKLLVFSLICAVILIFLPNILVSLTYKYQLWVASGDLSYVPTYFSFLGVIVFLSILADFMVNLTSKWTKVKWFTVLSIAFLAGFFSFIVDFHNHYVTNNQRLSQAKWRTINRFIRTEEFSKISTGSIIYSPTLFDKVGIGLHANDIDNYVTWKSGKTVFFAKDEAIFSQLVTKHPNSPTYYAVYRQEPFTENQYFVFSKLADKNTIYRPLSKEVVIYSYSKNKKFTIIGNSSDLSIINEVFFNGKRVPEQRGSQFAFVNFVDKQSINADFYPTYIHSDSGIDIDTLTISYFLPPPRLAVVAYGTIDFREPNYPSFVKEVQGVNNHEYWGAWTNGYQTVIEFAEPLPQSFTLLVTGGAWAENINKPIGFKVGNTEKTAIFERNPFNGPTTVSLDFTLNESADTIKINIPFPGNDRNKIGIGLITLRFQERK